MAWLRTQDRVVLATIGLCLAVFVAGLASHSPAGILLGKSAKMWLLTLASSGVAAGLLIAIWRFDSAARWIKRAVLLGGVSLVLFEATGFLFPKLYPLPVLRRTPQWVQDTLGDGAFVRSDNKPLTLKSIRDDGELAYRMAPNLDLQVIEGDINYREITDSNGFANVDETLYDQADVVIAGDSFTRGWGVELDQSWPQGLAQSSGLRVLNLGHGGWHMYQYPRVLERFAADLSPSTVVVTLTSFRDLSPSFYLYADYRLEHPEITNWHEFPGRKPGSSSSRFMDEVKQHISERNFLRLLYRLGGNVAPFATNTAAYMMDPLGPENLCKFSLSGTRIKQKFTHMAHFEGSGVEHTLGSVQLDRVAQDLARIRDFATAKGARLHIVYLPYPEEIYVPLLSSATELNECASSVLSRYQSGEIYVNRFYPEYEKALGPDSAPLVDATPYLQSLAAEGQQLVWISDNHPNQAGHQGIAEFIAALIEK